MTDGDPYTKVKKSFTAIFKKGLSEFGFNQYKETVYFYRDRGDIRDVIFFQKMRGSAFCVAYGVSVQPDTEDWAPGIKKCKWLQRQKLYRCKYIEHAENSATKAVLAIESEALPWIDKIKSV